ncbi:MAG TPA: archaellin/type IV pilin N-terminal domain-containing protein [Nitrososphaerales archaeon]|nr:archaellin/type IV pilin N-terminal domain-containing protein [Nitrososphaerales archaeon]
MQVRRGISPFIATVILVAITVAIGGVLYTQFRQIVTAEVRNPSISLVDANVGVDRQTVTVILKNDGNVQYTVSAILLSYQSSNQRFVLGSNATVVSGSSTLDSGQFLSVKFTVVGVTLPEFSSFTLTVVSDQLARAFTVQA